MPLRYALAAASAALLITPAAAFANPAGPANVTEFEAEVAHDDLDLTTREGVSRLDERVRTRVRQMCQNGGRDSASVRLERECRASALAATATSVRVAIANARIESLRFAERAPSPSSPAATPGA
jgi:UrcA family protein